MHSSIFVIGMACVLCSCAHEPAPTPETILIRRNLTQAAESTASAKADAKAVRELVRESRENLSRADGKAAIVKRWLELRR